MSGAALLLGLLLARPAAAAQDPLAAQVAENRQDGFSPKARLDAPLGRGRRVSIRVFRHDSGEFDRLRAWLLGKGAPRLVYLELSSSQPIDFDKIHDGGKLPDLYGDGSKTLVYHLSSGTPFHALRLVRFAGLKAQAEPARLGDATLEDVDGDGKLEIVSRTAPLGGSVNVECGSFWSATRGARRTTIYAFEKGRLAPASQRYAAWFDSDIARLESAIERQDPRHTHRYGAFLGDALSLYFDHAEKGEARRGWARFDELFQPSPADGAQVRECVDRIRDDLRRRLSIPSDW